MLRPRGDKLALEVPRLREFRSCVEAVFDPQDRQLSAHGDPEVWLFEPECHGMLVRIVEVFWPGVYLVDLVDAPPEPAATDDVTWDHRFSEWFKERGERRSAPNPEVDDLLGWMFGRRAPARGARAVLFVTVGAPWEVIHAAWRALSALYQVPNGKEPDEDKWKAINEAYATLKKETGK